MNDHNHVTRDIKPLGQCPACDRYHDKHIPKGETIVERLERVLDNLLSAIHSVQCTGPNQKAVLEKLYKAAEQAQSEITEVKPND